METLFDLVQENNRMLKEIIAYLNAHGNHADDPKEFMMNVLANLISNKYGNK